MYWKEMMDEVMRDLHAFAPVPALTQYAVFRALTEAQHELQLETSTVRRVKDVALSTMDANGVIPVGGLINILDRGELILPAQTIPAFKVEVIDPEAFQTMKRNGQVLPPKTPYVAILDDTNVLLYPYTGVTGTLRLHYQPKLLSYAASETEQWPGFAGDFANKIKTTGPEPEYNNVAQKGMIAYAKMHLFHLVPDARYNPKWDQAWEKALELAESNDVGYAMNAEPKGYFVAVD